MELFPGADSSQSPPPPSIAEPLVPLLRVDEVLGDPVAMATWHEALSDALSVELPHDLLGLWLYPAEGEVVLLGPSALAQDDLAVPMPAPQLQPGQLAAVEEVVRVAGYRSVICLPIRFGRRDVGLLLAADLRPDRYGEVARLQLQLVTQRLAPMLGRVARQWGTGRQSASYQLERVAALLDGVAQAHKQAATPQLFVSALSRALEPLLPHDHLELLVSDATGARSYRLGEHVGGAPWTDPSLILSRADLDPDGLFGTADQLLLGDACRDLRWPRGYFTAAQPAGAELRAVAGARLKSGRTRAYLLAGSVGPDLYDADDVALIARVAGLIAPQVSLFVLAAEASRPSDASPDATAALLAETGELLASSTDVAQAIRQLTDLARHVVPFDELRFAIRLSEGDRVVLLEPGEARALPDLPSLPVAGTALAQVLRGELAHAFTLVDGEARLIVPLRVAGRVHGALVMTAAHPAILREAHAEPARHLANLIAPHLELLRRAALLPAPYLPGWKRAPKP
jgi:hypothetical protein